MRRLLSYLFALIFLFVSIEAEFAAIDGGDTVKKTNQYGIVYFLDFENNQRKPSNIIEDDGARDFEKLPDNGLLIVRLLPKSMLKGTILDNVQDADVTKGRTKRSPGGCSKCGGSGSSSPGGGHSGGGGSGGGHGGGGGFGGGQSGGGGQGGGQNGGGGQGGGPGVGGGHGGGQGGGSGGGGGGGKVGAWSSSSSGAYSKGSKG